MDFVELVETESRGLTAAVVVIVGDWARAEEIVQDAFERAFVRWRRVSHLDRPGAWVRRVAINAAISAKRRSTNESRALVRISGQAAPEPDDPLREIEDAEIWAAVRRLPRDQAAAVALRYAADLAIADIAETMHLSETAVKSLLHRARVTLRQSGALTPCVEPRTNPQGGAS
ncbi:MAG: sigma-70 family RNA polymerase sigma factor [Actinobacteria bacterium]|nr:sigma-70 family RNA polymerase sigma factor [Actinomycetota bacterium]